MENRKKVWAVVGTFHGPQGPGGMQVFAYDEDTGELTPAGKHLHHAVVGNAWADQERGLLYFVDEQVVRKGGKPGGGVIAARLDGETGEVTVLSEGDSLSANPAGITLDRQKKYAVVVHHVSRNSVVRIVRDGNGEYAAEKQFDDAALVLFALDENGSVGPARDVFFIPAENGKCPHLHSVYPDPSGEFMVVCDKGLDKIYTFRIDSRQGKLCKLDTVQTAPDTHPRYAAFHPEKPYLYTNSEEAPLIYVWQYCRETGKLEEKQCIAFADYPSDRRPMPSDIVISKDGRHLYIAVRNTEEIAVMDVGENGLISRHAVVSCGGVGPRGLRLSPDGKFLFAANLVSGEIASFRVLEDGSISDTGKRWPMYCPGNITFVTCCAQ